MARHHDTVSFLSDYGLADEFVGVVHSVIRTIAPHVAVVDVTHEVPPHDVRAGALPLVRTVQSLPPATALAAHGCNGVDLPELGEPVDPIALRPGVLPLPRVDGGRLHAEVLWVDRFGNAQLNVGPEEIEAFGDRVTVQVGDQTRTGRRATT